MELQFTKNTHGVWVSEFEAKSDFNLHIERKKGGIISLYQRTTGGGWDHVDAFEYVRHQASIDFDCAALVYPKWCKIESEVEPSYAAITTDGEVTEIKSQSKEVEITSNGTTQIAPDAGFSYLTGVTVKTNVPQSGGGDTPSQPSGGISYEYYDISNVVGGKAVLVEMATLVKTSDDITTLGLNLSTNKTLMDVVDSINAIAIDKACEMFPGENMTVGEFFAIVQSQTGANPTPITKEEFYTL